MNIKLLLMFGEGKGLGLSFLFFLKVAVQTPILAMNRPNVFKIKLIVYLRKLPVIF